jgi:hypothetical protein
MVDGMIDHQHPERLSARATEFIAIHLVEQNGPIEHHGAIEVALQLGPANVENAQLELGIARHALVQPGDAAPQRLQPLETRMMENAVKLLADQPVEPDDQPGDLAAHGRSASLRPTLLVRAGRHGRRRGERAVRFKRRTGGETVIHAARRSGAQPVLAGILATIRIEVVSSSNCNQGRRCATAL